MPTLRELMPSGAKLADADVELMRSQYEYLIKRRDELLTKMQVGVLSINAASLVALLTALGGKGEAANWLGLDQQHAFFAACSFVAGILGAGWSIWFDGERYRREAGDAITRLKSAESVQAAYELSDGSSSELENRLEEHSKKRLVGFQFSATAIALQAFAGAAWTAGIVYPLSHVLGWG